MEPGRRRKNEKLRRGSTEGKQFMAGGPKRADSAYEMELISYQETKKSGTDGGTLNRQEGGGKG